MQLGVESSDGELSSGREPTEAPTAASASGLLPELPLLDRFVFATLVFGAHLLVRIGHLDRLVFDELLHELHALRQRLRAVAEPEHHAPELILEAQAAPIALFSLASPAIGWRPLCGVTFGDALYSLSLPTGDDAHRESSWAARSWQSREAAGGEQSQRLYHGDKNLN